jgi:hypothetical protein
VNVDVANRLMAIVALVHENTESVWRQLQSVLGSNSNELANALSTAIGGKGSQSVEVGRRDDQEVCWGLRSSVPEDDIVLSAAENFCRRIFANDRTKRARVNVCRGPAF